MLLGQQRVGQVAEEELEEPGDAVDVVEEVFGVAEVEVEVGRVCEAVSLPALSTWGAETHLCRTESSAC